MVSDSKKIVCMGQTDRHTDGLNTSLKEYFTTHRPVCNWLLEGTETTAVLLPVSR